MNVWKEFREKIVSDRKVLLLLIVFVVGLVLFALTGNKTSNRKKETADMNQQCLYVEQQLENRVEKLLSGVPGIGKIRVMIIVDRLARYSYITDEKQAGEEKTERKTVIVENGGTESGLCETVYATEVRGIAVCCTGGGSAQIKQEIVSLLSAVFGIGANRISVAALE